jgi:hypothetical protein
LQLALRRPRLFVRQVGGDGDEGAQRRVQRLDPLDAALDQRHRRELAPA